VDHAFDLDAFFAEHARAIKPDGYALYEIPLQDGGAFEAVEWKSDETVFLLMLQYFRGVIKVETEGKWKWMLLKGKQTSR
jgi:hypothetical protein